MEDDAPQQELLLLRAVADATTDAVLVVTTDGVERWRNRAARELVPPGAVQDWALHRADGRPLGDEELPHVVATAGEPVLDLRVRCTDDAGAPVLSLVAVTLDGSGETGSVAIILRDVSEEWRERSQLHRFAGAVAHDLKGPLAAMDGWLAALDGALAADPGPVPQAAPLLARATEAAARMRHLINALLDHARASEQAIVPGVVQLSSLVDDVVEARGLRAVVSVPDELPAVEGDAVLLRQVLDNVLANAVAYAEAGATSRVVVRAHRRGGMAVLHVQDDGRGIHEQDLDRVWRPFERAAPDVAGHGLGLPLSRTIVERHGGTLSLSSRLGVGTTVEVCLPAHPDDHAPEAGLLPPRTAAAPEGAPA